MNGRGGFIDALSGNVTPIDLLDISNRGCVVSFCDGLHKREPVARSL